MDSKWQRRPRRLTLGATIATVVVAASAAVLVASASGALRPRTARAATAPATGATTTSSSTATSRGGDRRRTQITHLPGVVTDGTRGVALLLNGVPTAGTPRPTLTPHTAGTWGDLGDYEFFKPASTLAPCTSYTMRIPAETRVERHRVLGESRTVTFNVACPGITAVQEALARLNYLPYTLHGFVGASSIAPLSRAAASKLAYELPHGILLANVPEAPPLTMGITDATTAGAMEVFEGDHNLPISATVTPQLWTELLADETLARRNPHPYTWVTVTETLPETLEVHEGRKIELSTPANTGVPGAATQQGIFPIYVRYVTTTMTGTNVDGSHYVDPGVPWVNYFNGGDAVHGYPRPGYGYPQSNGCVELPIPTAETVFGMLAVGDLVIVS
jgi:lipoprotein-anchoring transpeptidase ErfK/SrfK